ncbi:MAG: 4-hydroxy-3-methylbut-2-enyl diphosphate reductase [Coriobacteriia bacterium]|nr:4-hydroxy-3-methylbut-2-enyl diphosphate reductase [Coriobacteriia bacterium]
MNITCAKNAGACYGVQRALDLAVRTREDGLAATTLGPLIHNPLVVADLAAKGISEAGSVDQVTTEAVIIRSHGVVPQVKEQIRERGLVMVDATCPYVARAQKAAARLAEDGYHVLVVGECGHPEVEGLRAYALQAGGQVTVAGGVDELPDELEGRIGVVVQTTQMRETLDAVLAELDARGIDPKLVNTICFATRERQEAAAQVAGAVDAMVVIGGRNSSNTTRLADICKKACPATYHIESADELDPAWFAGVQEVGVTAGASTPESHIRDVVAALEQI